MCARGRSLGAGMQIALIGTGKIGGTLGQKFQQAGHEVVYGSRNSSTDGGPGGAPVVAVGEAIAAADVVVFAIPGPAVAAVAAEHGAALGGKVVVDATNRVGQPVVNNHAEIVAAAPEAKYVRAFNTLGWENFADPLADADLFFAADPEARATAETLISAVGLRPQYVGDADATATVDALLPFWFALVKQHGGNRKVALRVVE
jgi:8-hydroxy-5-deazaflavin:NADPH oxidoreductase